MNLLKFIEYTRNNCIICDSKLTIFVRRKVYTNRCNKCKLNLDIKSKLLPIGYFYNEYTYQNFIFYLGVDIDFDRLIIRKPPDYNGEYFLSGNECKEYIIKYLNNLEFL